MTKKKTQSQDNGPVTSGAYQPPITVRVLKDNTIIHDDKTYTEGDTVEVPARTAEHLIVAGHVEAA
jgi:hypothetical protein